MSESKKKKTGSDKFANAIAKAKANKAAKRTQTKKDRDEQGSRMSSKLAFQTQMPVHKQGAPASRIRSRAKKV